MRPGMGGDPPDRPADAVIDAVAMTEPDSGAVLNLAAAVEQALPRTRLHDARHDVVRRDRPRQLSGRPAVRRRGNRQQHAGALALPGEPLLRDAPAGPQCRGCRQDQQQRGLVRRAVSPMHAGVPACTYRDTSQSVGTNFGMAN